MGNTGGWPRLGHDGQRGLIVSQRFVSRPDGSVMASSEHWAWLVAYVSTKARTDAMVNGGFSSLALEFIDAGTLAAQIQTVTPAEVPITEPDTPGTGKIEVSTVTAAEMRGCSPEMIRRMCRAGQIEARRLGRSWLIDAAHLNQQTTGNKHYGCQVRSKP